MSKGYRWNKELLIKETKKYYDLYGATWLQDFKKYCVLNQLFCPDTVYYYFDSYYNLAKESAIKFKETDFILKEFIIEKAKEIFEDSDILRNEFYRQIKQFGISRKLITNRFNNIDNLGKECNFEFKRKLIPREKFFVTKDDIIKKLKKYNGKRFTVGDLKTLKYQQLSFHHSTLLKKFGSWKKFESATGIKIYQHPDLRFGTNEMRILDYIEKEKNIKLERQYSVGKFFLDGYDKENNIAYEVDERHHKFNIYYDLKREEYIRKYINCDFIRIQEKEYINLIEVK